ncbi:UNVERIFIED_CONTAM: hypothetical protein Sradi_3969100 [Sesamum radiatum]|uniref:Uncharacterized protein n=1 Tax=Sesamum radiatum TaxID=300843 RepID=A0AAW2PH58_SESRA
MALAGSSSRILCTTPKNTPTPCPSPPSLPESFISFMVPPPQIITFHSLSEPEEVLFVVKNRKI